MTCRDTLENRLRTITVNVWSGCLFYRRNGGKGVS